MDARKPLLGRVGMIPEHVSALQMPDLAERPLVAPVRTEDLPSETPPAYKPRKLPQYPGVEASANEV